MKKLSTTLFLSLCCMTMHGQTYSTSWIANDGGWEEAHIPHDMLNMYTHADGTVATICGWDEGGTNVGVYRNGKLISRPEGSGTGGWGRFSGVQVVLDDRYVYQLLTQHGCDGGNDRLNQYNLRQFPPCDEAIEWKTVRRYDRETGLSAPFPGGYGYKGDMLVVATERPRQTLGLAIDKKRLYVALSGMKDKQQPDSVKMYDVRTLKYLGGYALDRPGGLLYADRKDGLWIMSGNQIIRMEANTGKKLSQSVRIPEGVKALSFSIDTERGRLLLPNRGRDMNVLVYGDIFGTPKLVATFGRTGGVFAKDDTHLQGQVGPLRFSGPCGAGVDAKGTIYICNTSVSGGRGAVLEAYEERSQRFLWKVEGLIFTATADVDRSDPAYMYTPEKIHCVDYGKSGTRLDELVAFTADPFAFPDDERVLEKGAFVTSCWKRTIEGRSFLFISDMYGGMVAGYRFDPEKHGYIGIPFLFANNGDPGIQPERPLRFWVDRNGDARRDADEWLNSTETNQYSMSFFVDHAGNIWRGTRQQGVMFWRMKGLSPEGVPQYEAGKLFPLPEGTNGAKRVWYDAERDELFIGGFSAERQDPKDTWWCMGSTIAKYVNYLRQTEAGVQPKCDMRFHIPFHHEDGSGLDHTNAKAFCVEGDYIFVALAREGIIHIYNRSDGQKYGELKPDESVHKQSGWADFNYCINVHRQPDGTYLVMNEENAFGKVMVYRMKE